jgi:isopentenyl diphosphate isomerase/L-lactate dehydrogenase-like FMN-dependent dehydrogenase
VALALDIYRREIDRVMGLCGWSRLSQVDRSVLGRQGLAR